MRATEKNGARAACSPVTCVCALLLPITPVSPATRSSLSSCRRRKVRTRGAVYTSTGRGLARVHGLDALASGLLSVITPSSLWRPPPLSVPSILVRPVCSLCSFLCISQRITSFFWPSISAASLLGALPPFPIISSNAMLCCWAWRIAVWRARRLLAVLAVPPSLSQTRVAHAGRHSCLLYLLAVLLAHVLGILHDVLSAHTAPPRPLTLCPDLSEITASAVMLFAVCRLVLRVSTK